MYRVLFAKEVILYYILRLKFYLSSSNWSIQSLTGSCRTSAGIMKVHGVPLLRKGTHFNYAITMNHVIGKENYALIYMVIIRFSKTNSYLLVRACLCVCACAFMSVFGSSYCYSVLLKYQFLPSRYL